MSKWTHAICDPCWTEKHPGKIPTRLGIDYADPSQNEDDPVEVCCFCGRVTAGGIFVRQDPLTVKCGGNHAESED